MDGSLGPNWTGETNRSNYKIAAQRVDVGIGEGIYWRVGDPFGVTQEAYITLTKVDSHAIEQGLLLKVQGGNVPHWTKGAIGVLYDARHNTVRVETFKPIIPTWTIYPNTAATFVDGDVLGGRVRANGDMWIYQNCVVISKTTLNVADQAFFNPKNGRIGLWLIDADDAFFDNFGGGSVLP